jgi:GNAT superfamily N-acetyltransferase
MPWTTLATLNLEAITAAVNRVFESFTAPTWLSVEQMGTHLADNQVVLEYSPLWLSDAGEIIGLGALAIRESRGWIAAFGISPEFRNQGLSHVLIEKVLKNAVSLDLKTVQLEVRTDNFSALSTYGRAGFHTRRSLCTWKLAPESIFGETVETTTDLTACIVPYWQRESATLQRMQDLQTLKIGEDALLFRVRLADVSIHNVTAKTPDLLLKLLSVLQQRYPEQPLRILNEPVESPLSICLKSWGWEEAVDQYEMFWENKQCAF